jgi:hypothetical protein
MTTKTSITLEYSAGWVSVNNLTALAVGTPFFVQNNGKHAILASESVAMPSDDTAAFKIYPEPGSVLSVSSEAGELWVKNNSSLNVISLSVGE